MLETACSLFTEINTNESISHLKEILFKIAECNWKSEDPHCWVKCDNYTESECFENSSIFLEEHQELLDD